MKFFVNYPQPGPPPLYIADDIVPAIYKGDDVYLLDDFASVTHKGDDFRFIL